MTELIGMERRNWRQDARDSQDSITKNGARRFFHPDNSVNPVKMRLPRPSTRIAPMNLEMHKSLVIKDRILRFMGRIADHGSRGQGFGAGSGPLLTLVDL